MWNEIMIFILSCLAIAQLIDRYNFAIGSLIMLNVFLHIAFDVYFILVQNFRELKFRYMVW